MKDDNNLNDQAGTTTEKYNFNDVSSKDFKFFPKFYLLVFM